MNTSLTHGIDILSIQRMEIALSRSGERFLKRIFTDAELAGGDGPVYLARRFAAKEAFFKALGTGLSGGTRWHDIEILNGDDGQPLASVSGKSLDLLGNRRVLVSVSATSEMAAAIVILS